MGGIVQVGEKEHSPWTGGLPKADWTGLDPSGVPLPTGRYTFALESFAQGVRIATTPAEAYARVVEVRGGATPTLVFEGGVEVEAKTVTALRGG